MSRLERKKLFIKRLAHFLAADQAAKSVLLEMNRKNPPPAPMPNLVKEWMELLAVSPVRGWASVKEAEKALLDFLL